MYAMPSQRVLNTLKIAALVGILMASCFWPRNEPGYAASAAAVTAGGTHTCALTAAGGIKCWGGNAGGQLGDGSNEDSNTPVEVDGLTSGVAEVSAGEWHACALTTAGAVKCWGNGVGGQLGNGSNDKTSTPADVDGLGGVAAVSAGAWHTCAVTAAGGVRCWGSNAAGQLGDGSNDDSSTPVEVDGLSSGLAAISAGGYHTCALTTAGGVKCWGNNDYGQLGDGSDDDSNTPVDVDSLASGVAEVSAGEWHACALTTAGGVHCWGNNDFGQLGDGSDDDSDTPVDVDGLDSGVAEVSAGRLHTCALTTEGDIRCWGSNADGQLGDGSTDDSSTPMNVGGLSGSVAAVSAGRTHTCALSTEGGTQCWGRNQSGQLGDGTFTDQTTPVDVIGLKSTTGDVNCDDVADSIDAALVLQFAAGIVDSLPCQGSADVNGDTVVNAIDAALILQYSAGIIPSL
jgi:alpha-tubulin suppressor-like RCC1 family protein